MPLLKSITTPYAEAFLQVADGRNETEEIVDQARQVLALWQESPELREAMASPILEVDAKKAALGALFADQLTPSFLNLLKLLADRQRIGFLDAVLALLALALLELRQREQLNLFHVLLVAQYCFRQSRALAQPLAQLNRHQVRQLTQQLALDLLRLFWQPSSLRQPS